MVELLPLQSHALHRLMVCCRFSNSLCNGFSCSSLVFLNASCVDVHFIEQLFVLFSFDGIAFRLPSGAVNSVAGDVGAIDYSSVDELIVFSGLRFPSTARGVF